MDVNNGLFRQFHSDMIHCTINSYVVEIGTGVDAVKILDFKFVQAKILEIKEEYGP